MINLDEIAKRYEYYSDTDKLNKNTAVYHVRILLEEVARLNEQLDSYRNT